MQKGQVKIDDRNKTEKDTETMFVDLVTRYLQEGDYAISKELIEILHNKYNTSGVAA